MPKPAAFFYGGCEKCGLVAATLETQWEQSLHAERELRNDYQRHQQAAPTTVSNSDRARIRALSTEIPML